MVLLWLPDDNAMAISEAGLTPPLTSVTENESPDLVAFTQTEDVFFKYVALQRINFPSTYYAGATSNNYMAVNELQVLDSEGTNLLIAGYGTEIWTTDLQQIMLVVGPMSGIFK